MDLRIIEATKDHIANWDEYVLNHPNSNVYQLYNWKKVIFDTYGHEAHYIMAVSNNSEIMGILPLVKINAYGLVKKFTSIPFFDLGGILANDKKTEELLIRYAFEVAKKEKISSVSLRQQERLISEESIKNSDYPHLFVKRDKVRLILELGKSSEELFSSFKSKLRSQIRKPIKEGLKVKIGGLELVDDFYRVFVKNMRFLGSPVHSKNIIINSARHFPASAEIFIVYKDKFPVASSFVVSFKNILYNPWASSLREYSRLSPNMLLYWEMLKYACEQGFTYFDFGRSAPGEGTYRFKKQWGAKQRPIYWYIWSKREVSSFSKQSRLQRVVINVWQKLPLKLTQSLGPIIRKYIDL